MAAGSPMPMRWHWRERTILLQAQSLSSQLYALYVYI